MVNAQASVLVVDDEQEISELLYADLSVEGYLCRVARNGQEAIAGLKSESFNVVLLDVRLPDISGMDILKIIDSSHYDTTVIMMTGIDSLTLAVEAMKCGAVDYILKPFSLAKINESIQNVLGHKKSLSNGNEQIIPGSGNNVVNGNSPGEEAYKELDAIATGVQARHDLVLGHSKIIIKETVEIARQLGLEDGVIKKWIKARLRLDSDKRRDFKRSLDILERSQPAQELMGLMRPYRYLPTKGEREN